MAVTIHAPTGSQVNQGQVACDISDSHTPASAVYDAYIWVGLAQDQPQSFDPNQYMALNRDGSDPTHWVGGHYVPPGPGNYVVSAFTRHLGTGASASGSVTITVV